MAERKNVATKLIESHLVEGIPTLGSDIALRIDQTLTQDATGTLVMLELEAMGLDRVRTELSAQYVDHNLIQIPVMHSLSARQIEMLLAGGLIPLVRRQLGHAARGRAPSTVRAPRRASRA